MESDRESVPRVSVIVPVSERPQALDRLYREFARVLRNAKVTYEFLFVAEPWAAESMTPLKPLIRDDEPIRLFELGRTMGESAMLEAAARQASGTFLVTLPAYPRIEASALPGLIEVVEAGADLAVARRRPSGRSRLNRLQSRVFHGLLRLAVGGGFRDVASGVRVMRREVLAEIPLYGDFFRFLPILAQKEGFRVQEVDVAPHAEEARTRLYSPGTYLRRLIDLVALAFVVRFTRKPLRFFGLMGTAAAVVGGAILLVLFVQRMGGEGIADRPMLLLGVLCFILGIQAIAIGLVGEIIVHLNASTQRHYRVRQVVAAAHEVGPPDTSSDIQPTGTPDDPETHAGVSPSASSAARLRGGVGGGEGP